MSDTRATSASATSIEGEGGLLEQILAATKQTERDRAADLVRTLVREADADTIKFEKNLTRTIQQAVKDIDDKISAQLNEILHNEKVRKLEGTWRGLQYLVRGAQHTPNIKVKVLNVTKRELTNNFARSDAFDQSHMWSTVYESGFGQAGGEPFAAIVGDYEWTRSEEDVETLQQIAGVCGASFAPFITAPAPSLLGLTSWTELRRNSKDLARTYDQSEYTKWRSFRDTDDARYVTMVMPRVLARRPYGTNGTTVDAFNYEEAHVTEDGVASLPHDEYCWMNASYALAGRMTTAFAETGFCTAIRGAENGGKVENLPLHNFVTESGDHDDKCPTEVNITDRREADLGRLGLMPLVHYKNHDYAVFFGGQTTQKPKKSDLSSDNANAEITARLPYVMATARFAHYLKVMARDKIGSFLEAKNCENWLNRWIAAYVNDNPDVGPKIKAEKPLREARVEVEEVPGQPGAYNAVAYLRPWLQMDDLTVSMRMVARIPKQKA